MNLRSCLYECRVMHHRLAPKQHRFEYRIFMFALDLDEIDEATGEVMGFSRNRWNLYSFHDRDHISTHPGSLKENLVCYLAEHGIEFPAGGRVTLVTLPRVFGYVFNPVSFYYCFDVKGKPLCAIAEVGNTFGEMKLYLIRSPESESRFRLVTPKHFYVSPFSGLELNFDFKLRIPDEHLEIHIDDCAGKERVLLSTVSGVRTPLTSARLAWFTLKYPLVTLRVIFLIHWNAMLLWLKRIPWHAKAAHPEMQRDVLRPHASISDPSL